MLTPSSDKDLTVPAPIKLALVIPNYNHNAAIAQTLAELAPFNLPCYLIDDGSNDETRYLLQALAQQYTWVTLLQHPSIVARAQRSSQVYAVPTAMVLAIYCKSMPMANMI